MRRSGTGALATDPATPPVGSGPGGAGTPTREEALTTGSASVSPVRGPLGDCDSRPEPGRTASGPAAVRDCFEKTTDGRGGSGAVTFIREGQPMTAMGRQDRAGRGEPATAKVGDHGRVPAGDAGGGGGGSPAPSVQGGEWTRGLRSRTCAASTSPGFQKHILIIRKKKTCTRSSQLLARREKHLPIKKKTRNMNMPLVSTF